MSLSLGLIVGFVLVEIFLTLTWKATRSDRNEDEKKHIIKKVKGMYSVPKTDEDDPEVEEEEATVTFPVKVHDSPDETLEMNLYSRSLVSGELKHESATFFDSLSNIGEQEFLPQDHASSTA